MATETEVVVPHDQTSVTDEQVEKKMKDVKTVEQDTVSLSSSSSKEGGEEKSKAEDSPSVPDTSAKYIATDEKPMQPSVEEQGSVSSSKESREEEKTEAEDSPGTAPRSTESAGGEDKSEVQKAAEPPISDVPATDKTEENTRTVVPETVTEVKKSQADDQVAVESVIKEEPKEEYNEVVEKGQDEQPKIVDVPILADEVVEKPKKPLENTAVEESESEAVPAKVEKKEPEIPKVEEKLEEIIKTTEPVTEKDFDVVPKESVEVGTVKNEEASGDKVEHSVSLGEGIIEKDEQPSEVKSCEEVPLDQKVHGIVEKAAPQEEKKDVNESDVVDKIPKEAGLEIGKVREENAEKNVEVERNTQSKAVTEDLTPLFKEEAVTVTETAAVEDEKKDSSEADAVEKVQNEVGLEVEKDGKEYAGKNVEIEEKVAEDSAEVAKVEGVSTLTSTDAITENPPQVADRDIVLENENKTEEQGTGETRTSVETNKKEHVEDKLDQPTTAIHEPLESKPAEVEVKEKETKKTDKDKSRDVVIPAVNEPAKESNQTESEVKEKETEKTDADKSQDAAIPVVNEPVEESKQPESEVKEKEIERTDADKSQDEVLAAVKEPGEEAEQSEAEVKEKETEKTEASKSSDELVTSVDGPVEVSKKTDTEVKEKESEKTDASKSQDAVVTADPEPPEESKQTEPEVKENEIEKTDANTSKDEVVTAANEELEESKKGETQAKETEQTDPLKLEKEEVVEYKSTEEVATDVHEQVEDSKQSETEKAEPKSEEVTTAVREVALEETQKQTELRVIEQAKEETEAKELEKDKVEDTEKSDKKLETLFKDGDETKPSKDLTQQVQAKPAQKQSNNIISKVKNSLVKAKKAIIGKSPSKTPASEAKGDIKVK